MNHPAKEPGIALSGAQLQLWAGQQLAHGMPIYNMAIACRIHGPLDPARFHRAFQALVDSTDALRAVLVTAADGSPRLHFPDTAKARFVVKDLSRLADPHAGFETWVSRRLGKQFDLATCSYDSALLRLGPRQSIWYFNQHHLLVDAWSMAVLLERLSVLYERDRDPPRPEQPAWPRFRDHLRKQADNAARERRESAQAHWRGAAQETTPTRLYAPRPHTLSGSTRRTHHVPGAERMQRLRALCARTPFRSLSQDLSRFRVIATVLFALLHRLTGEEHLTVGVPVHHRGARRLRDLAGMLIELFPIAVQVEPGESFRSLHDKVAREMQALLRNAVPGASSATSSRSFDVVLNFITATFGDFAGHPVDVTWLHPDAGDPAHVLRLQVHDFDADGELQMLLDGARDALSTQEQEWLAEDLFTLLDAMLEDSGTALAAVPLLRGKRRDALLATGRGAPTAQPPDSVVARFERQVAATPDATAVIDGECSASYAELDARASRLADGLRRHAADSARPVAIALPRSLDAVVAILGVLKSGRAYVPLDPDYPARRLRHLIEDCGAAIVLCEDRMRASSLPEAVELVSPTALETGTPVHPAPQAPTASDAAYLIYTSGSTGAPKGTVIEHGSLATYLDWAARQYTRGEPWRFALFTSLAFDLTVTSLFVPLISGGSIVVYRSDEAGDFLIRRVVQEARTDVVKLTPAHLALVQDLDLGASGLRVLVVGGEDFKTSLARTVHRRGGGRIAIYNEYGPTEATVACTIHRFDPESDRSGSVPIGRPIDGAEILLLERGGELAPRGVVAEIGIAGAGLARGYHGDPVLTGERFVQHPLRAGQRIYRSGDRGYWDRDNVLHYLGRLDHQVKVNGVRVETAEVEAVLGSHPAVAACAVDLFEAPDPAALAQHHCVRCGLEGRHPEARLDAGDVCAVCRSYENEDTVARAYFGKAGELRAVVERVRASATGSHDSLMLLSGGKDSTYALCKVTEMGLRPLVFTLDNGFISEGAKNNIRQVVEKLGLELVIERPASMNEIFRDSLRRYSNVCNGCFKTIYTLAMNLAHARGIRHIITGLSRGQIFETRLAGLSQLEIRDPDDIDRMVVEARKAYHRMDDAISRCLDVSVVRDDEALEAVEFIDFYRYCDATLEEILDFLSNEAPWIRPADTGRSTNCLINDAGIHVHQLERNFHNYALPYSWDVRLGHKQRDEARRELEDSIDVQRVEVILDALGYVPQPATERLPAPPRLAAWYVAHEPITTGELREWLGERLPGEFVPAIFMPIPELPLNANHKVDRARLPQPGENRPHLASAYIEPRSRVEHQLVEIWEQVLGVAPVGVEDDFFELGGDSLLAIQIVTRAQSARIALDPQQIFTHPTIAALASVAGADCMQAPEPGPVVGELPLLPGQREIIDDAPPDCAAAFEMALLHVEGAPPPELLQQALHAVVAHHDALRTRITGDAYGKFQQRLIAPDPGSEVLIFTAPGGAETTGDRTDALAQTLASRGLLFGADYLYGAGAGEINVLLAAHPLVVDDASWRIIEEDLVLAVGQRLAGEPVQLPPRSHSLRQWVEAMGRLARSPGLLAELGYWSSLLGDPDSDRPDDARHAAHTGRECIDASLDATCTRRLLRAMAARHHATVAELLVAAVAPLLRANSGAGSLRAAIRGGGRDAIAEGIGLARTVGRFGCPSPIALFLPPGRSLVDDLRDVKSQLRAVPRAGMGFGILCHACPDRPVRATLGRYRRPEVAFGYPQLAAGRVAGGRLLRTTGRQEDRPVAPPGLHPLEVSASLIEDRLHLHLDFDPRRFAATDLREVLDKALARILSLSGDDPAALSPSDFPQATIDQSELDAILAEFDDE